MQELTTALEGLSTPMLAMLAVLVLVQIGLEVYAVIDIIRRPVDRITGGNKLLWIVVVLFINMIGAIIYLAVGRKPTPARDVASEAPATQRASDAADILYGRREDALSAPVPPTEPADSSTVASGESAHDAGTADAS
ncbi:MAG: PLD nuclease N-terminal domain-containing protein [Coriobacteriia bacterium]